MTLQKQACWRPWIGVSCVLALVLAAGFLGCNLLLDNGDAHYFDVSDGGGDASLPRDAGSYCASLDAQVTFCRDFDESDPFDEGFDPPLVAEGGILTADEKESSSPPRSLVSEIPKPLYKAEAAMRREFNQGKSPTDILLRTDVHVDEIAEGDSFTILYLSFDDTTDGYGLGVDVQDGSVMLHEYENRMVLGDSSVSNEKGLGPLGSLPSDSRAWVRVNVHVQVRSQIRVDAWLGDQPDAGVKAVTLRAPAHAHPPTLLVGISYVPPNSFPWRVHYDNIVLDFQ